MHGILALHPHVFGRLHDPGAEEMLPHPIHLDAGRQRVLRQKKPLGEAEPVGRGAGGQRWQESRRGEHDLLPLGREIVAPVENLRVAGFLVAHHHHAGPLIPLVVVEGSLGGVELHDLRQILDDARLHLGVEVTAKLVLDRFLLDLRAVFLRLAEQRRETSRETVAVGRLTV